MEPALIRQLFQNLISNSIKFRRKDVELSIRIYSENLQSDSFQVIVEDNGIGFRQDSSEIIFKPFERLHGHSAYEGTGLGLSICQKIISRYEGDIRAEGQPGKGARFILTFMTPKDQK